MEEFFPERYSIIHLRRERCASNLWKMGVPPEHIPIYLDLIEQYDQVQAELVVALSSVKKLQDIQRSIATDHPEAIDTVLQDFEKGYQLYDMLATLEEMHEILVDMSDDYPIE